MGSLLTAAESQGEVSVVHLWVAGEQRDYAVSWVRVLNQWVGVHKHFLLSYSILTFLTVTCLLLFLLWVFLDLVSIYFHMTLLKEPKLARIPHSSVAEWDGRACHLWYEDRKWRSKWSGSEYASVRCQDKFLSSRELSSHKTGKVQPEKKNPEAQSSSEGTLCSDWEQFM